MVRKNNKLMIMSLIALILVGGLFAGTHRANQILSGTFLGNYSFENQVSFQNSPQINQSYYYLPKNSNFVVNSSNCVDNGANYKCAYEADNDGDGCPDDMARVGDVCVDKYEASYDCNTYTTQSTTSSGGAITTDGGNDGSYLWQTRGLASFGSDPAVCMAISKSNQKPYTTITQYDAKQSCLLAGKSLIKNSDWQRAVIGTPDDATKCNINSGDAGSGTFIPSADWYNDGGNDATYTGSASTCVSKYGVYDMIGNVWEWTDDLIDAVSNGDNQNTATYGSDKVWRQTMGSIYTREGDASASVSAFLRGGNWNNGANAGAFALNLNNGPSNWNWNIGFRCTRSKFKTYSNMDCLYNNLRNNKITITLTY